MSNKKRISLSNLFSPLTKYGRRGLQTLIFTVLFPSTIFCQKISLQFFQNPSFVFRGNNVGLYYTTVKGGGEDRFGNLKWYKNINRYGFLIQKKSIRSSKWTVGLKYGRENLNLNIHQSYRCRLFATQGDPSECTEKRGEWVHNDQTLEKGYDHAAAFFGGRIGFLELGIQWNQFVLSRYEEIDLMKIENHKQAIYSDLKKNNSEYYLRILINI